MEKNFKIEKGILKNFEEVTNKEGKKWFIVKMETNRGEELKWVISENFKKFNEVKEYISSCKVNDKFFAKINKTDNQIKWMSKDKFSESKKEKSEKIAILPEEHKKMLSEKFRIIV
ncbi:MAG TPA: hypothetical protein PLX03_02985 [Candidatus Hydrogenedentes bacterium]|nr:hypothetical protein [Candidatus Hydrogenedentota bacterium]